MIRLLAGAALAWAVLGFDHGHGLWREALARLVKDGRVAYEAARDDPGSLQGYLKELETAQEDGPRGAWSREQSVAFWINAYNAFVVQGLAERYPLSRSEQNRAAGLLSRRRFTAAGRELRLSEIERELDALGEPRARLALACGAIGCPRLSERPYMAADLDGQLEEAGRRFFSEPKNASLDQARRVVRLSSYLQDGSAGDPLALTRRYAPWGSLLDQGDKAWRVEWLPFDSRLNEL